MRWYFKEARIQAGYSQETLANALGVSEQTIIRIEKGEHAPQPGLVSKIYGILGNAPNLLQDFSDEALEWEKIVNEVRRFLISQGLRIGLFDILSDMEIRLSPKISAIGIESYIEQCNSIIPLCKSYLDSGDFKGEQVYPVLSKIAPVLGDISHVSGQYQYLASKMGVDCYFMLAMMQGRNGRYDKEEGCYATANELAQVCGDESLIALTLFKLGDTPLYHHENIDRALPKLEEALRHTGVGRSLVKALILSDLCIIGAMSGDIDRCFDTLGNLEYAIPHAPTKDELYQYYPTTKSEFLQFEGHALSLLTEKTGETKFAETALEKFSASFSKIPSFPSYLSQLQIRRGGAYVNLGELDDCTEYLNQGLDIAVKLGSVTRKRQIQKVLAKLPPNWQEEHSVQILQRDVLLTMK